MTILPTLEQMCLPLEASLRDALQLIDNNAQGICFIVSDGRVRGVLTDGDIRRAILAGRNLTDSVSAVMQKKFTALPVDASQETIQSTLSSVIRHIPLVDKQGRLVDFACANRYRSVPLMEPVLDGNELAYVTECITTRWISSKGKYVTRFEEMFSAYCKVPHAVAVSNGTVALHLALVALGVSEGDEVIVPDLTFAASVNAVLYCGATPVLVDVDPVTWTMDPKAIVQAITPRTKALIPVHLYGHPCDMDTITKIAQNYGLMVIEDCAEALGSLYKGAPVGSFGDAATFSFYGNKTITTGEGGMVLFRDAKIADQGRILRDHGMSPKLRYWHECVGYNYRMTNMQAAIGVAQMERLGAFVEKKRTLARLYSESLASFPEITLPPEEPWATNSFWLYTVMVSESLRAHRDAIMQDMLKNGIETRPVFIPMHGMPPYRGLPSSQRAFPISEMIAERGISLPSSVLVGENEVLSVVRSLRQVLSKYDAFHKKFVVGQRQ